MSVVRSCRAALSRPVSAYSLAVFRIAFGALLVWDCWRFLRHDRIDRYYVEPVFHFHYPGFGWIAPLPEPYLTAAWLLMGCAALLVMLGLFYRLAVIVLTVLFTYFFLLDRAEYLNHFYLAILFAMLLSAAPAHRAWSLDAGMRGWRDRTVPFAAVFMLRAQVEIVLFYAGLVKVTPDWLAGEPLGTWLRRWSDDLPGGRLLEADAVILAGAWGTVALHVIGAPLLLWRRTRLAVFALYCLFHLANAYLFPIGIFPWLAIAATTIVFAPDWPHRLARWFLARFEPVPPRAVAPVPPGVPLPSALLLAMAAWLAVQVVLPLRANLFASEVRWTGDGHLLSWRMRIYDRDAEGHFIVETTTGESWVMDPTLYLTKRQARKMMVRPDMIHQFAAFLDRVARDQGHGDVVVRAAIRKSLNGRPPQPFIDPDVDLTAVAYRRLGADPWVRPMEHRRWGLAENRGGSTRPSADTAFHSAAASTRAPTTARGGATHRSAVAGDRSGVSDRSEPTDLQGEVVPCRSLGPRGPRCHTRFIGKQADQPLEGPIRAGFGTRPYDDGA